MLNYGQGTTDFINHGTRPGGYEDKPLMQLTRHYRNKTWERSQARDKCGVEEIKASRTGGSNERATRK